MQSQHKKKCFNVSAITENYYCWFVKKKQCCWWFFLLAILLIEETRRQEERKETWICIEKNVSRLAITKERDGVVAETFQLKQFQELRSRNKFETTSEEKKEF